MYAYLKNCPLNDIDLYGLYSLGDFGVPFYNPVGLTGKIMNFFGFGLPKNYEGFENAFTNKSKNYNLSDFGYQMQEMPIGKCCFGNGIGNNFEDLREKALLLSGFSGGFNIHGVYNATHGISTDLHEAAMNLFSHTLTSPVHNYHQEWDSYFSGDKSGAPLLQICHSQGSAQLRNALEAYPKERRDRIVVAAFAPLAYISPELCMKVRHYVCDSDPVTYIDFIGRQRYKDSIVHIKRNPHVKQSCHEFLNPIYGEFIKQELNVYQNLLKKYD